MIFSSMGSVIVEIIVGPTKVPFSVHKNLISSVAPSFQDEVTSYTNNKYQINLPAENPAVFKLFVNYGKLLRAAKNGQRKLLTKACGQFTPSNFQSSPPP
jgi:hypothetical protein